MKFALKFLLALAPFSAFATEALEPVVVRMLDGRVVACQQRHEVGNTTFSISGVKASVSSDDVLDLGFDANFLGCVASGRDSQKFSDRRPLDSVTRRNWDGSENITIDSRDADFFVGGENFITVLPAKNESSQHAEMHVKMVQVLSPAQLRDLEDGKVVSTRLLLSARSIKSYTLGGVTMPLGIRSEGAFSITLRFKK